MTSESMQKIFDLKLVPRVVLDNVPRPSRES